jgi:hypothetical protein
VSEQAAKGKELDLPSNGGCSFRSYRVIYSFFHAMEFGATAPSLIPDQELCAKKGGPEHVHKN